MNIFQDVYLSIFNKHKKRLINIHLEIYPLNEQHIQ